MFSIDSSEGSGSKKGLSGRVMMLGVFVLCAIGIFGTASAMSVDGNSLAAVRNTLGRPLSKRSFFDIQCKGSYDKSVFAQLERVCDDCFNLYRETQLHALCRSNCFGSTYFKGCMDALLLNEEESKFDEMIEILGKK